jgi:hypothetical protein
MSLVLDLRKLAPTGWHTIRTWNLLPESKARSLPDYIPAAIIEDYREACLIASLSPIIVRSFIAKMSTGDDSRFLGRQQKAAQR